MLVLKIKNIILIYFQIKNNLKNNHIALNPNSNKNENIPETSGVGAARDPTETSFRLHKF
jgi:hypothetical protein